MFINNGPVTKNAMSCKFTTQFGLQQRARSVDLRPVRSFAISSGPEPTLPSYQHLDHTEGGGVLIQYYPKIITMKLSNNNKNNQFEVRSETEISFANSDQMIRLLILNERRLHKELLNKYRNKYFMFIFTFTSYK